MVLTQVCAVLAVFCSRSALPGAETASYIWAAVAVLGVLASCVVALEVSMVAASGLAAVGGLLLVNAVTAMTVTGAGATPFQVLYLTAAGHEREGVVVGWAPEQRNLFSGRRFLVVADLQGRPVSRSSEIDAALLPSELHPALQAVVTPEDLRATRPSTAGLPVAGRTTVWVDRWGVVEMLPAPAVSGVDLRRADVVVPLALFVVAYGVLAALGWAAVRAARPEHDGQASPPS